jgi:hypothetical protein
VGRRSSTAAGLSGVSWRSFQGKRWVMRVLFIAMVVVGQIGFASMIAFVLR